MAPSRTVTTLALLQVMIILGGWLIERSFVRAMNEVGGDWLLGYLPSLVLFMGKYGLWFLAIPVAWVGLFSLASDGRKLCRIDFADVKIGIVIAVLLFIFFAYVTLLSIQGATTPHGPMTEVQ